MNKNKFILIENNESKDIDTIELRLYLLSASLSEMQCDDDGYLWKVQEKVSEAIFWYNELLKLYREME